MKTARLATVSFLVAFAVISAVVTLGAQKPTPIPVFVTSAGAVNGLTDPNRDNNDTARHLAEAIKDRRKSFTLTDRSSAAVIILTLTNVDAWEAGRGCTIHVTLSFKGTALPMSAHGIPTWSPRSCDSGWSRATTSVAKQVEEWVITNRTKLTEPQP
jgi:hypothetical protein